MSRGEHLHLSLQIAIVIALALLTFSVACAVFFGRNTKSSRPTACRFDGVV